MLVLPAAAESEAYLGYAGKVLGVGRGKSLLGAEQIAFGGQQFQIGSKAVVITGTGMAHGFVFYTPRRLRADRIS